jgi:hypothetical protein
MPTIRRPNVPPATIRLTRTRPAGDAAGVAYGTMANPRVTVTGAPAGTAAFVDYRTAAIAPVGTTSGLTYEVPAGSFAVRFVAPGATPRHVAGVMESDAVIARSWASLTPSTAPLRIVNLPNGSQVFVGESTTPLSVAALVGDSRAGVTLTVPAGSQTFRVVARDGSVRTQTVNVPWRWAENLLRILNFLRITPGMTVQEADEKLTFGLTQSWAPHDHEDARFLLAALPSFVISEDASLNLLPPLATLVSAAAETVLDYSAMPVATPATSTGSGTGVESRTRVTGTVSSTTGIGIDGAAPPPRTGTVRTVTGIGGAGVFGGGGSGSGTPAPPSLRIDGRPQYSTLYVDSAANVAGAWTDASQTVWRMPLAAGAHTLRIVPTTGAARTGSVTVPATGEATIAWGSMVEERPAQPDREEPAVTPDEPIVKPEERRDPVAPVDDEADKRAEPVAGVRAPGITILAGSGVEGITATRVGGGAPVELRNLGDGRWGATLPSAGRWNLTASTFEGSRSDPHYGEDTSPEPVEVGADEVLTLTYAQAFHPVSEEPPQDHNTVGGRVIVRTSLPNVAAMLQGGPTVSGDMARAADGTLTASVASGTYQLVAWQEATPMRRTDVRTANVTVRAGEDVAFVYTGAELRPVFMSVEAQLPPAATNPHTALLDAGASQTFVLLHSIGRQR